MHIFIVLIILFFELGQKEETLPNQLELPYDDPASYTWDILVFIVPQILRCLGIKGMIMQ